MKSKFKITLNKSMLVIVSATIIVGGLNLTTTISKAKENKVYNVKQVISYKDQISFKDKVLEYAVRDKIHKPTGNILESDLVNIKDLNLKYMSIQYLEDIKYFSNLENIDLNGSCIHDLSPLKNLKKLRHLGLMLNYSTGNFNTAVLSDLTNLESLDLSKGKIHDLTFLSTMTNLKTLNLNSNEITDLSTIKNLNGLENITLKDNHIMDISILKDFKNLKTLDISGNPISKEYVIKLKESIPNCNINCFHLKYADENTSEITALDWQGYAELWDDNINNNIFNAKFEIFNGTDTKIITSNKAAYSININTHVNNGDITIKIYNDNKTLFEKNNPTNENIIVSKEDAKNVKIQTIGKKAKGNVQIEVN